MNPNPLVSVIVPVYNCEEFLEACLESLMVQTYTNIEVVAVDDGSTDKSSDILERIAGEDRRIKVMRTPNRGLQSAWMTGVRTATGELIGFVDADDWVHPTMFQALVDASISTGADIVQCGIALAVRGEPDEGVAARPLEGGRFSLSGPDAAREVLRGVARGHSLILPSRCLKLFDRAVLLSNLEFCSGEVVMGEDVNITVPCLLDVDALVCLESKLYFYRQNPASLTNRYLPGLSTSNETLLDSLRNVGIAKGVDLEDDLMAYFGWLSLRALVSECRGPCGLSRRVRRVTDLYRDGDVRLGLKQLRAGDVDWSSRIALFFCSVRAPFLCPLGVLFVDWVVRLYRSWRRRTVGSGVVAR